ncbi:hypothetical protein Pint_13674 [Pistacia integerrima]|uniref:Uncharacterized protein n=1 Tax=Pistacia integerrima TaxID=434235 RepID=A0ACC0Y5E7_9ROSI|nr:hypothetical protein Pint_13674 [Pistacia integerrima]
MVKVLWLLLAPFLFVSATANIQYLGEAVKNLIFCNVQKTRGG